MRFVSICAGVGHGPHFLYSRRMRCILMIFLLFSGPSLAQEQAPQGIGFAQAEEGTWLCRHDDPGEALSCARELCLEQASGQECWQTAWCFPANWSGLMTIWLDDFHTTHVLCGAPSEASLTEALEAICAGDQGATSCDVTMMIDPDGNERPLEGVSFVGPAGQANQGGSAPAEPGAASGVPAEAAPGGGEDGAPASGTGAEAPAPGSG